MRVLLLIQVQGSEKCCMCFFVQDRKLWKIYRIDPGIVTQTTIIVNKTHQQYFTDKSVYHINCSSTQRITTVYDGLV